MRAQHRARGARTTAGSTASCRTPASRRKARSTQASTTQLARELRDQLLRASLGRVRARARCSRRRGAAVLAVQRVSKAAFNPGAGFGPYAIPKAALLALVKQYALELGAIGIRSNAVNADRIRSGLLDARRRSRRARRRAGCRRRLLPRQPAAARGHRRATWPHAFFALALAERTTGSVADGGRRQHRREPEVTWQQHAARARNHGAQPTSWQHVCGRLLWRRPFTRRVLSGSLDRVSGAKVACCARPRGTC